MFMWVLFKAAPYLWQPENMCLSVSYMCLCLGYMLDFAAV